MDNVIPLNVIKIHLKRHMLESSDALYLLTLLTNANVEANNVDQDQKQSIMCFHCLTQRLLKHFNRR